VHDSVSCPLRALDFVDRKTLTVEKCVDLVQREGKNSAFEFDGPGGFKHRLGIHDHALLRDGVLFYTQPNGNKLSYWVLRVPGSTSPDPSFDPRHVWQPGSCYDHRVCLLAQSSLFHQYRT